MRSTGSYSPVRVVLGLAVALALAVQPAWGGGLVGAPPSPVNVLQDCWTTNLDGPGPDPEFELYEFTTSQVIDLFWKHKILVSCSAYTVRILFWDCRAGKPKTTDAPPVFVDVVNFGTIDPIPGVPEQLLTHRFDAATLPPGRYDWAIATECDDTNGAVTTDGDVDDICGGNLGRLPVFDGPVIFGPEPFRALDPDPGGSPPGRGFGEDGSTRPWCFDVVAAGAG